LESGEGSSEPTASGKWRMAFGCAMLAVILLICGNITTYQYVASDVSKYAAALESGLAAEQRGDWDSALTHYESAGNLACHPPKNYSVPTPFPDLRSKSPRWDERERLSRAHFYDEAFRAADLEFIFLRLPGRGGPSNMPYQVAEFGVARCLWNAGKTEQAVRKLENGRLKTAYPDKAYIMERIYEWWPEAAYAAGEMYWHAQQYEQALGMWVKAANLNRMRKPFPPLEYPFDVAPSMDEIYQKLDAEVKSIADLTKPADIARRVALLLRLGRQEEAVNALRAALADASELVLFRTALKVQ
jgi:tetratricopeptide (TPR) repeat protein